MNPKKLFAIVGYPLGHSLSPALHNWGFSSICYPGVYMAFPQQSQCLNNFFSAVRTLPLAGGNITIPFKIDAMKFVDLLSPSAQEIGAINTFYWQNGLLCGENTDVLGFMESLEGEIFSKALILGAGGVSRAVISGLKKRRLKQIFITNRSECKAKALADEFRLECVRWEDRGEVDCDMIINATSLGMRGQNVEKNPYIEDAFVRHGPGLAYDVVYTPEKTVFLKTASKAGWKTRSGVTMFVEQARAAFFLWTKKQMPKESAYTFVREALVH